MTHSVQRPDDSARLGFSRRGFLAGTAVATGACMTAFGPGSSPVAHADEPDPVPGVGEPYAYYWYPDSLPPPDRKPDAGAVWRSLLKWDPATDPDLAFNTSTVPLAQRRTARPFHVGQHRDQARVQSLASFGPTAKHPAQGGAGSNFYNFTHWAYVDEMVFWGGSAGEGIIKSPAPHVTDAAHRNGVPVLGTIFLPPTVYGGLAQWSRDLVQKRADGTFPVADKLIEVATVLGFDGWFINAETEPDRDGPQLAKDMIAFVQYLRAKSSLRIVWYDSLTEQGRIAWQNQLNTLNDGFLVDGGTQGAQEIFLNFWWGASHVATTAATSKAIGRPVYDSFFGIDTGGSGYNTNVNNLDTCFDPSGTKDYGGSLGVFGPAWTWDSIKSSFTPEKFQLRDHTYWVGPKGFPALREPGKWPGVAAYVPERTTITRLPFTSAFGTGAGDLFATDGTIVSRTGWHNLSAQDIAPQRRWVTSGHDTKPRYDYSDAYQAGESIALDLSYTAGGVDLFLFGDVTVAPQDQVEVVAKGIRTLAVRITTDKGTFTTPALTRAASGWQRWQLSLAKYAGQQIRSLAVVVTGTGVGRLGQVRVGPKQSPEPPQVEQVKAVRSGDGVRVTWTKPQDSSDLHHVEVWADGAFAGVTSGLGWYLPTTASKVEVVSVSQHYVRSGRARATVS